MPRVLPLSFLFCALLLSAADKPPKRWEMIEYGPYISGTFDIAGQWTYKGILVRLGSGAEEAHLCYDIETLRVSGAWSGGFINFNNVIFDGEHHAQPKPKGTLAFHTNPGPGWAREGSFDDPRKEHSGPLPRDWIKYNGLYLNGSRVVLAYSANECKVLETPGVLRQDDLIAFTRTLTVGPSEKELKLFAAGPDALVRLAPVGGGEKADLSRTDAGFILTLAPSKNTRNIALAICAAAADPKKFESLALAEPENLEPFTHGGAPRWKETVTTQGRVSTASDAYVVDVLSAPEKNPYNAWMRFGGFDFFKDGKRAALCTWSGDVWIVSGIDGDLQNLVWKRFATGLYQPLGLKIVDDVIYTTGRDQITRLHDLNGDGEADYYECFNGDCVLTRHFHEFALDLQTDGEGNFYYAKGSTPGRGGPNFDLWSVHNGCYFRVPKDGSKLEVVARGLRAPNGIGVSPTGMLTSSDNEGSWVPECPINWIKPGGFVGIPDGVPGEVKPTKRDPPICWIPWHVDNSSGGQMWVTSDRWGPLKDEMLHLSYGKCSLFHVMTEHVTGENKEDIIQGGVVRFPLNFESGAMRGRFNALDGQLYVCGLRGWQTTANRDGTFARVRYTGKPVHLPYALHVTHTGVDITFTDSLDPGSAGDAGNYTAWWFNVQWTKNYGSARYSPTDPNRKYEKQKVDPPGDLIDVKSAKLSADGKTVSLEIPGIKPVTNMIVRYKIKFADGAEVTNQICITIHVVP